MCNTHPHINQAKITAWRCTGEEIRDSMDSFTSNAGLASASGPRSFPILAFSFLLAFLTSSSFFFRSFGEGSKRARPIAHSATRETSKVPGAQLAFALRKSDQHERLSHCCPRSARCSLQDPIEELRSRFDQNVAQGQIGCPRAQRGGEK